MTLKLDRHCMKNIGPGKFLLFEPQRVRLFLLNVFFL